MDFMSTLIIATNLIQKKMKNTVNIYLSTVNYIFVSIVFFFYFSVICRNCTILISQSNNQESPAIQTTTVPAAVPNGNNVGNGGG